MRQTSPQPAALAAPGTKPGLIAAACLLAFSFGLLVLWAESSSHILLLVLGLLASVVTVGIWRSPFLGTQLLVAALFVTIPVVGQSFGGMAFFNIRLSPLLALITLPALILRRVLGHARPIPMRLGRPFTAVLFCDLLSLVNSAFLDDSLRYLVKVLGSQLVLFFVLVATIKQDSQMERVVRILAWAAIVSAWAGFVQVIAFRYFGMNWFMIPQNPQPTAFSTEYGWYGIYSSVLLAFFLPLITSRAFLSLRFLLAVASVHCATAVALSVNRGAMISCAALALVSVFPGVIRQMAIKRRLVMVVLAAGAGMIAILAATYLYPGVLQRMAKRATLEDASSQIRLEGLKTEWDEFMKHPVVGNGVGTWGRLMGPQISTRTLAEERIVRGGGSLNMFSNALYQAGLLGCLALLCLLGSYLVLLQRGIKKAGNEWNRALLNGCLLAFISVIINSQVNPLYLTDYAWAIVALGVAAYNISCA